MPRRRRPCRRLAHRLAALLDGAAGGTDVVRTTTGEVQLAQAAYRLRCPLAELARAARQSRTGRSRRFALRVAHGVVWVGANAAAVQCPRRQCRPRRATPAPTRHAGPADLGAGETPGPSRSPAPRPRPSQAPATQACFEEESDAEGPSPATVKIETASEDDPDPPCDVPAGAGLAAAFTSALAELQDDPVIGMAMQVSTGGVPAGAGLAAAFASALAELEDDGSSSSPR